MGDLDTATELSINLLKLAQRQQKFKEADSRDRRVTWIFCIGMIVVLAFVGILLLDYYVMNAKIVDYCANLYSSLPAFSMMSSVDSTIQDLYERCETNLNDMQVKITKVQQHAKTIWNKAEHKCSNMMNEANKTCANKLEQGVRNVKNDFAKVQQDMSSKYTTFTRSHNQMVADLQKQLTNAQTQVGNDVPNTFENVGLQMKKATSSFLTGSTKVLWQLSNYNACSGESQKSAVSQLSEMVTELKLNLDTCEEKLTAQTSLTKVYNWQNVICSVPEEMFAKLKIPRGNTTLTQMGCLVALNSYCIEDCTERVQNGPFNLY